MRTLKIVLFVFLVLIVIGVSVHTLCLDGIRGVIFSPICKDTTVYAPGYSDEKYRMIKVGMSKKEVLSILGKPMNVFMWKKIERYCYTASSKDSHYRIRQIYIDKDKVVKKEYYYYLD